MCGVRFHYLSLSFTIFHYPLKSEYGVIDVVGIAQ